MKTLWMSLMLLLTLSLQAAQENFGQDFDQWKNRPRDVFSDPEANFKKVKETLSAHFVSDKLSDEILYQAAVKGMLEALNHGEHQWNKLLTPTELKEMESDLKGQIAGIGVEMKFDSETGIANIIGIVSRTPAQKAGLKIGDQIVSVDGRLYKGLQFRDLVYDIRGKVGEKVKLKVLRGDEVITKTLARQNVSWLPVEQKMLEGGVALIKLSYFAQNTPTLLKAALAEAKAANIKGLILDLRQNAGGLFEQAVESAGFFLPKGATVVKVQGRNQHFEEIKNTQGPLITAIPVLLLTSKQTSSGAELFAAALKEHLGAKSVGEKTLGKWNAQTVEKLPNHFAIKYTTKLFFSPQGKSYQAVGLAPDIEVIDQLEGRPKHGAAADDPQLRAALNLL